MGKYIIPIGTQFFNNLAQSFRVHCLFNGQFNTKDYGTFTDNQYLFGTLFI